MLEEPGDADLAVRQLYRIGLDQVRGWITAEEAKTAGLFVETEEPIDDSLIFDRRKPWSKGQSLTSGRRPNFREVISRELSHFPTPGRKRVWPSSRKTSDSSFIVGQAGERPWRLPFYDRQDSMRCTSMESAPTVSALRAQEVCPLGPFTKSSLEAHEEAAL